MTSCTTRAQSSHSPTLPWWTLPVAPARSIGDLLACVLGGVYTDVEKTMIELERSTIVQETRSAFQNAMQHKFFAAIERLSGRGVLAFISNHHVGPDMEIEFFLLHPEPSETVEPAAASP